MTHQYRGGMSWERRRFLGIVLSVGTLLLFLLLHQLPPQAPLFLPISSLPQVTTQSHTSTSLPLFLFVIPGGGSGLSTSGYPEWTSRRTSAAYQTYLQLPLSQRNHTLFLALSAGSLNSPNRRLDDERVIFECQKTIDHLRRLGVPQDQIFGDFVSWANGLALRLFLEGYLATHPTYGSVNLTVFISDFHATRVKVSFEWILNLTPSLLVRMDNRAPHISLVIHEVSSNGLFDHQTLQERLRHEAVGVQRMFENQKKIRTLQEFYGFLFAGGHQGLWRYLHGEYTDGGTKVGY